MLNDNENKVVELLGQAWSAYLDLMQADQEDHDSGIDVENTKPTPLRIDDDTNDFRRAIHEGQRIVITKSVLRESRSGKPQFNSHLKEDLKTINPLSRGNDGPLITDRLIFIRLMELLMPSGYARIDWDEDLDISYFNSHGHRERDVDWEEAVGEYLYDPQDKEAIKELTKWGWIKIG